MYQDFYFRNVFFRLPICPKDFLRTFTGGSSILRNGAAAVIVVRIAAC